MVAVRGLAKRPSAMRLDAVRAHEPRDPVSPHPLALGPQRGMHPGTAVAPAAIGVHAADILDQRFVCSGAGAFWPAAPGIIAAGADPQHRAHHPHGKHLAVVLDEPEHHLCGLEKMPTAFFKMSRSICARSSSLRKRRISS